MRQSVKTKRIQGKKKIKREKKVEQHEKILQIKKTVVLIRYPIYHYGRCVTVYCMYVKKWNQFLCVHYTIIMRLSISATP